MKTKTTDLQSITIRVKPKQLTKIIAWQKRLLKKNAGVSSVTKSDALRYMIDQFPDPSDEGFDFLAELKNV